jgi:hypothetical protein
MKNYVIPILSLFLVVGIIAGCSSDASTEAMTAGFSEEEVVVTQVNDTKTTVAAKFNVILTNRTQRVMNIMFSEGTIVDAKTGEALVRFRPIVPDSYGSTSTIQLFTKQTQAVPVVTPLDLYGFNPKMHPQVMIKMFYNTDGYRLEATSGPIPVQSTK